MGAAQTARPASVIQGEVCTLSRLSPDVATGNWNRSRSELFKSPPGSLQPIFDYSLTYSQSPIYIDDPRHSYGASAHRYRRHESCSTHLWHAAIPPIGLRASSQELHNHRDLLRFMAVSEPTSRQESYWERTMKVARQRCLLPTALVYCKATPATGLHPTAALW